MIFPSRSQLIRDLSLTRTDQMEISKRRGDPHRLGFAYQLGFVRVFQRFPVQQPLEICEVRSGAIAEEGIDATLLQHVSPIEWDNVILYGQYVLDRALVR